jgi:hypothetical protein
LLLFAPLFNRLLRVQEAKLNAFVITLVGFCLSRTHWYMAMSL